jgi:hypothetical protein
MKGDLQRPVRRALQESIQHARSLGPGLDWCGFDGTGWALRCVPLLVR